MKMVKLKSVAIVAIFAHTYGVASVAMAQNLGDVSGCQSNEGAYCVPAGGAISLQGVQGDVSVLRNASATSVKSDAILQLNDRVVMQDGTATVVLSPTCKISAIAFSSALVSSSNGLTCVTLGSAMQTTDITNTDTGGSLGLPLAIGALGGAMTLTNNSNPVSP